MLSVCGSRGYRRLAHVQQGNKKEVRTGDFLFLNVTSSLSLNVRPEHYLVMAFAEWN